MQDFLIHAEDIQQPIIHLGKDQQIIAMNETAKALENFSIHDVIEKLETQHAQKIISWTTTQLKNNETLFVGTDVTVYKNLVELNENQQNYLDFVVANIPCYIYWKDCNSIYLGCNEKFAKVAGCKTPADIIGKSDYDLVWGKTDADLFRKSDIEVFNGKSVIDIEEPQLMADGKYATVLASKVPIRNKAKKIIGVLGIYLDITQRKQAEEQLQQAKQRAEAFGQIAVQAAHDIRSPLAALEAMLPSLKAIQESQRVLIRNALERIKDIANNLLLQHKAKEKLFGVEKTIADDSGLYSQIPILLILESIISEKRSQYKARDLAFTIETNSNAYALFAEMRQHQFKRLLSNIIDNAVEAIKAEQGHITIKLVATSKNILLSIEDNGSGIPADVLPKIFASDFSYGKKHGSGLGLAYAKKCIEDWGGTIAVSSQVEKGTQVTIKLNLVNPPAWYPKEIVVNSEMTVVVLDDDKSGHDLWGQRFSEVADESFVKSIVHFYRSHEFVEWYQKNSDKKTLFLMDYELINDSVSGLDLIEKFNVNHHAILVTSHFENIELQKRCIKLNVRLFSKMLANYIPIRFITQKIDFIYLDDNPDITSSWEFLAKSSDKNILTFNHPSDLLRAIDYYPNDTPIYIDSDLGKDNIKGEFLAKELYEKGFHNIYLATGHPQSDFGEMPWIKGIMGKIPPALLK